MIRVSVNCLFIVAVLEVLNQLVQLIDFGVHDAEITHQPHFVDFEQRPVTFLLAGSLSLIGGPLSRVHSHTSRWTVSGENAGTHTAIYSAPSGVEY